MAIPKKGQLHQFMVPLVDSTDFASIESGITESDFNSGATVKFYGVNHGTSAAFTSGTVSKTGRLVRSGVFQITLKGTENNYDEMMVRINKTGVAEQIVTWANADYDDSDIMSRLSDVGSDLRSYLVALSDQLSDAQSNLLSYLGGMSDTLSDVYVLLSDVDSNFQSRIPKEVASKSLLSDVNSDLASKIAGITASVSASDISDIASAVWAAKYTAHSNVSSFGSLMKDNIYLLLSDLQSDFQSRVPKEVASKSLLSDVNSNMLSYLAGLSNTLSAVLVDTGSTIPATISQADSVVDDIYSLLSDLDSNFQSRVPKETAARSQLSDLASDVKSAVTAAGLAAAGADITAVPGVTGTYGAKLDWLFALARNKVTQTSALAAVFNDAGSQVASATVSDDATTFTRQEWAG